MSELEEKLNSVLNNPEFMQQLFSMAQSIGAAPENQPSGQAVEDGVPALDPNILQNLLGQSGIDKHQTALLQALSPYLSSSRVQKLERAMQAARMAGTASRFLSAGGLQMYNRR